MMLLYPYRISKSKYLRIVRIISLSNFNYSVLNADRTNVCINRFIILLKYATRCIIKLSVPYKFKIKLSLTWFEVLEQIGIFLFASLSCLLNHYIVKNLHRNNFI